MLIATQHLEPYDAIGSDVAGMAACLERAGYRVEVVAEGIAPALTALAREARLEDPVWDDPDALLIYHHSMGWKLGERLIEKTRARVVVRYHNITPAEFFEPYSPTYAEACREGEASNARVAAWPGAMYWGASEFNCAGLRAQGAPTGRCRALAPFHYRPAPAPDPATVRRFRGRGGARMLFVGGIKPNKGHRRLIEVAADYRREVDAEAQLVLAGKGDARLSHYEGELRDLAWRRGMQGQVRFTGALTAAELRACYLTADVFVCMSEHEGFCVPLVEAMRQRVPIVAYGSTAVAETVGDAGLVWRNEATACFVESIRTCVEEVDARAELVERGARRYRRLYDAPVLERRLLELVEEAWAA